MTFNCIYSNLINMHQGKTTFGTQELDIHIRTYRSLLKSAGEVRISQLIASHAWMKPLLHEKADSPQVDIAAFIYVTLRLPNCMSNVGEIILGQSLDVFKKYGISRTSNWQEVEAPGRRRKMFYNGKDTLNVYIASVTDVDDMITLLTAFQMEWNKFHKILAKSANPVALAEKIFGPEDTARIKNIWGKDYTKLLDAIKKRPVNFRVRLLAGSYVEYAKATQQWWENIVKKLSYLNLKRRPIYFVSSNTHSLVNLLTRFAVTEEKTLTDYLYRTKNADLIRLWEEIQSGDFLANRENFLYYIAKKYARSHLEFAKRVNAKTSDLGIHFLPASHYLDIDTQVIEVKKLTKASLDPRLELSLSHLAKSEAVIINIDYPLGWAAYQVLTEIGQNVSEVKGVYIMGKAATLNGQIGDILLPSSVFDQHTKNIYVFNNCFKSTDFLPIFKTGMVLDHQKTISAKGTFLENRELLKQWYQEGYTIIEMESGPYLNSIYEFAYYNRYVENEFINLTNIPFELGIAHYASDTPYSKAKNLGVRNLSYEGVEPTYAISLAIIKKIIGNENRSK